MTSLHEKPWLDFSESSKVAVVVPTSEQFRWNQQDNPACLTVWVRSLCCLLQAHPLWPRNAEFEQWEEERRELLIENLEDTEQKIPATYRDEFLSSVMDLDFLSEFMNRKRDKKSDSW